MRPTTTAEMIVRSWVDNGHDASLGVANGEAWVRCADILMTVGQPADVEGALMWIIGNIRQNSPGPGGPRERYNPDERRQP